MSLINIEYGSLASSEVMNKNFLYLDDKIAESNNSIMTSISSILSNIATINSRLSDLSESVDDYVEEFNATVEDYKVKTKTLVNKGSMLPNWSGCYGIALSSNFTVPSNGYVLLLPVANSVGNLYLNDRISISMKQRNSNYDNASELLSIPVRKGDVIRCDASLSASYFLPSAEISIENF